MPNFKKQKYYFSNKAGANIELVVDVKIDAAGVFYANISDTYRDAFGLDADIKAPRVPAGFFRVTGSTFGEFSRKVENALARFMEPEVTVEHVIRYNIESHVSFALDDDGNIFPNAGFPGAKWPRDDVHTMFGRHHAASPAQNGYSLTIGARAMTKTTTSYGTHKRVAYEYYYKGGSHLHADNPAQLLNSWTAIGIGSNPKEIPYTDEAAMFFHRLLLGMATLNRQIQEATFNQERLLSVIEKQSGILLLQSK